ncbi:MAG: glutamine--fructose-6-phosphate transaminase (isomerizing) [Anderseniella sp.]
MCGIVGILGTEPVAMQLVEALRRLEYRGYDSAGIAVLKDGAIDRVRAPGKLDNLYAKVTGNGWDATTGIGHTRWATHGAPNETNAHPHQAGNVVVVHNGIIENYRALKDELAAHGIVCDTETDTEVVAQLVNQKLDTGLSPKDAVSRSLKQLEGAFSLGILVRGEHDLMIGARQGAPLAVGHGDGQMFLGSDAVALAPFTNRVSYLNDGDWVVLTRAGAEIFDENDQLVIRDINFSQASTMLVDKGNHRHFMAKEIEEQPEVIGHTLAEYVNFADSTIMLPDDLPFDFADVSSVTITACGTAFYAALTAKYWFEKIARLPVEVDIASEFRYREAPLDKNGVTIVISQSGETADTLAAMRYSLSQGHKVVAIVNVPESTIARESSAVLRTFAGPEIGVASTKAFTCQLSVLACLAVAAAKARATIDDSEEQRLVRTLIGLPRIMSGMMAMEGHIEDVARKVAVARDVLYLGRGVNYPIAMEGALKLKEISYIHAEGYAAGELKHGPIALIDEHVPVVVIAPRDELFEKTISNMQEVAARGGQVILVTDETGASAHAADAFETIAVPEADPFISPMIYAVPMQLLAYHAAVFIGTDVDQPRNLAKSVTVE